MTQSGVNPVDFVMKVYDTLALAEAGLETTALKVVKLSTEVIEGFPVPADPTINNDGQHPDDNFYTFQRYYIRLEAPEPVKAMYIDWDDGKDNTEEYANSEWQIFESPQTYGIFEHIFTKNSTFYPIIRLKNSYDFKSKYYTPSGGDHTALDSITTSAGQQGTSKVSIDSATNPRIPIFEPSNMPPTGVLKLSKNRIYSGIDNDNIDGTYLLYAYWDGSGITPTTVILTYEDSQGRISRKTITPTATEGAYTLTSGYGAPSHDGAGSIYAKRLLKAELVNMTEGTGGLNAADRIYIKANLGGGEAANTSTDPTITILSLGSPIQKERDAMYSLLADGSESRTRASNRTIENYFFEDDKLNIGGAVQEHTIISAGTGSTEREGEISDELVATLSNSSVGQKTFSYTFGNEVNQPKDSTGRFYDEQRLIRLQVQDDHTAAAGDRFTKSAIEHFQDTEYSIEPTTGNKRKEPTSLHTQSLMMFTNQYVAGSTTWVDCVTPNLTDNDYIIDNSGSGTQDIGTTTNIDDHPKNYLLIAKTDKFDRLHVRVNNGAAFAEAGEMRIVAWYAGKSGAETVWKPLKIRDGTTAGGDKTSLYRSGTISFNRPEDWTATQADSMYGGTLDSGVDEWLLADGSPVAGENSSGGTDPINKWTFDGYGILLGIEAKTTSAETTLQVSNIWPYNNSHSQPVSIVDPHHVSLNSFAVAQSISFGRNTKVRTTESRLGMTDIQKIGASGGSIKFGSPDFGTNRKTFKEYQQNATPVYIDVTHKNDEITRFYGVITKMSEDHPLGAMARKYSVSMDISYIIELNSDGTMLSDGRIALGGKITDEPEYIL